MQKSGQKRIKIEAVIAASKYLFHVDIPARGIGFGSRDPSHFRRAPKLPELDLVFWAGSSWCRLGGSVGLG